MRRNSTRFALGTMVLFLLTGLGGSAQAKKPAIRYVFEITRLDLPKNAPSSLEQRIRHGIAEFISKDEQLLDKIPEEAPSYDPKAKGRYGNKAFHKYMKKKRLRAFKVVVQVTRYAPTLVPNAKGSGQMLGSAVVLRMFGETIPDRVMAFTGDGSATIQIEIGKKARDRDRTYADQEAAKLAIEKAMAMSLTKLEAKPVKGKKKK